MMSTDTAAMNAETAVRPFHVDIADEAVADPWAPCLPCASGGDRLDAESLHHCCTFPARAVVTAAT